MDALARCIDHVVAPTEDAEHLFALLSDGLGFPVAWPVADHGAFTSGGITFGNGGIEVLTGSSIPFFEPRLPVVVRGIAFRPAMPLEDVAAALDARNIAHAGVIPFGKRKDGSAIGATLPVTGLLGDECLVYFIDSPAGPLMCSAEAVEALAKASGGVVGATSFAEVQIGVPDLDQASKQWQTLLDPLQPIEDHCWQIGDGPLIRLKESPILGVAGLVVQVSSLDDARTSLSKIGLLGPVRKHGLGIRHPDAHGLDIWLVQAPAESRA
ncbi:MAG: VOC family protein [Actinomycetota bacterium]